jgi:hypothetical protein
MDLNLLLAIGILLLLIVLGVATRPRRRPQHLAYRLGPELPTRRRTRRTSPG